MYSILKMDQLQSNSCKLMKFAILVLLLKRRIQKLVNFLKILTLSSLHFTLISASIFYAYIGIAKPDTLDSAFSLKYLPNTEFLSIAWPVDEHRHRKLVELANEKKLNRKATLGPAAISCHARSYRFIRSCTVTYDENWNC